MKDALKHISENPLLLSIVNLFIGSLLTILITRIRNKSGVLCYTAFWNKIGTSADDNIFGNVRIQWQSTQVRNLFTYFFEIENFSTRNYENINLKFWSGKDTVILSEQTAIINEPRILDYSPEFKERVRVPEGQSPTQMQIDDYNHCREYLVPILNRGQKLRVTFLCTKPSDDLEPNIFLSVLEKGIRLRRISAPFLILKPVFGVPVRVALTRGLFVAIVVVILCSLLIKIVWLAVIISMLVGLMAQAIGAIVYRVEQYVKKVLTR